MHINYNCEYLIEDDDCIYCLLKNDYLSDGCEERKEKCNERFHSNNGRDTKFLSAG